MAALERTVKTETRVRTLREDTTVTDWSTPSRACVQWGAEGSIIDRSDAHGVCYGVRHDDGTAAWYALSELALV